MVVEASMMKVAQLPFSSGRAWSIQWLMEFLLEEESGYPRFWGLLYWGVVLVVSIIPTFVILKMSTKTIPVVVARKWFHLIAVLLFGPIMRQFPQLMSLSFAIAVCVLIVLETLRRDIPALQAFYVTFVDNTKDSDSKVIVSHIAMILGCALPLWISQAVTGPASSLLLAEFGVICVGIGDAMGAVIGKWIGKHKWGRNQRTLEGSLAMWLSMILVGGYCCHSAEAKKALAIATTFTTILEAFTVQLDNLVLPLAGSAIVLLMS